jgi:hypothetical protein
VYKPAMKLFLVAGVGVLFLLPISVKAKPSVPKTATAPIKAELGPVEMLFLPTLSSARKAPPPFNSQTKTKETEVDPATPNLPNIGTSRSSFTDTVTTVPQGSLQVESGVTYTSNRGGTYSWTMPETLTRLGLGQNTELRVTLPSYIYLGSKQPGNLANNFGDISVGMSQHIKLSEKLDFAIIPILNIPTGANAVSTQSLDPQVRLVLGNSVTKRLFLSSMLDTRWYTGKQVTAPVTVMPSLIGYYSFTRKLTGFLEGAALVPTEGKTACYAQTGLLYRLSPRQQVDVRMLAGLNKNSPNILVGVGYSFRVDGLFGSSRAFSSFKKN